MPTNHLKVRRCEAAFVLLVLSVLPLQSIIEVLYYFVDESSKEQESFGREGKDTNEENDDGQRGGGKEDSYWWTRFQVGIFLGSG